MLDQIFTPQGQHDCSSLLALPRGLATLTRGHLRLSHGLCPSLPGLLQLLVLVPWWQPCLIVSVCVLQLLPRSWSFRLTSTMSSFNPWPHKSPVSASSWVPPFLPLNLRESTSSAKTETLQLSQDSYTKGQSTRLSVHLSVYTGDTCCPLGRLNSAQSILMSEDCREGTISNTDEWFQPYEGLKYRRPLVTTWDWLLESSSDTKTQRCSSLLYWKKV